MAGRVRLALAFTVAVLLVLPLATATAVERSQSYDGYTIYYNAMPTTRLSPDVANAYSLQRSRVRGVLMITVTRDGTPVEADVRARALNPRNQLQTVRMTEHSDGEGIYSLGMFRMEHGERMRFEVSVRPETGDRAYTVEFSRELFSD